MRDKPLTPLAILSFALLWPALESSAADPAVSRRPGGSGAVVARPRSSAYVFGRALRFNKARDRIEFALGSVHGVRVGAVLPVRRPIQGGRLVAEAQILLVDERQAVGRVPKGVLIEGDEVVLQRNLDEPPPGMHDLSALHAEITFARPAPGASRRTYHGRILDVAWAGPLDLASVRVELLLGTGTRTLSYRAAEVSQMRVNGVLMVPDPVKASLVAAAVLPLRETLRAEEKRIQELRLAEIQARERVRLAEIASNERVRVAEAQAQEYAQRALAAAVSSRMEAEREAREWKRRAEEAAARPPVIVTRTVNSGPAEEGSSNPNYVGRALRFVAGFCSLAGGATAMYYSGGPSLESTAMVAGGGASMWEAIKGR